MYITRGRGGKTTTEYYTARESRFSHYLDRAETTTRSDVRGGEETRDRYEKSYGFSRTRTSYRAPRVSARILHVVLRTRSLRSENPNVLLPGTTLPCADNVVVYAARWCNREMTFQSFRLDSHREYADGTVREHHNTMLCTVRHCVTCPYTFDFVFYYYSASIQ